VSDVLFNLPIDDLLFNLLFNQPLPRIPGWGPRQPTPEVTRPPEPPKFRDPGPKPSFDEIVDSADEIIDEMMARAQAAIDAGDSDTSLGDSMLSAIYRRMGYDGLPQVVDEDIFEQMSEGLEVWLRGFRDGPARYVAGEMVSGETAADYINALRFGNYYAGYGVFGNGTYSSDFLQTASSYGGNRLSNIVRILFSPSAKVIDIDELADLYLKWYRDFGGGENKAPGSVMMLLGDRGRFAAALGYDAIRVPNVGLGGPTGKESYLVILNRDLMILPKSDGLGPKIIDLEVLAKAWGEATLADRSIIDTYGNMYNYARSRGFEAYFSNGIINRFDMFD